MARGSESYRLSVINWFHVALARWFTHLVVILTAIMAGVIHVASESTGWTWGAFGLQLASAAAHVMHHWVVYSVGALCVWMLWARFGAKAVYLVDFSVFEPPQSWRVTQEEIAEVVRMHSCFTPESIEFQQKILARSGTGQGTAWPPGTVHMLRPELRGTAGVPEFKDEEPRILAGNSVSRAEGEVVMFSVMDDLLAKTKLNPKSIDFLIVNCSLFSPTPSLAAMVCRKYGLRRDCRTFNLSGMGCSASLISVDLAKSLLQSHPGSTCVVISLEIITPNMYRGNKRSMLVQNTLFRCGGAAMLLTSRVHDSMRAKYQLLHTVRCQDSSEEGYLAVYEREDEDGLRGVELSRDITKIAGRCLTNNFTMLGPLILPIREQLRVVGTIAVRKLIGLAQKAGYCKTWTKPSPYVPDFKKAVQHFCIHAGGRAVIDGVEANLRLSPADTAPSRAALKNFGNTSSSSIWYEMKYVEQEGEQWVPEDAGPPVRRGERVLQVAFGSGFKCNSAVWLRLRK